MNLLELRFLGSFQVSLNGQPLTAFESNKVRALLAYLAVEARQPHPRESLAGLLWPDWPQQSAMSNLRYALADLRKNLLDRQAQAPFLLVSRGAIQFNKDSHFSLDINDFDRIVSFQQSSISDIKTAIALFRSDFLDGFSVGDSAVFEQWVVARREHYHQRMLKVMNDLAERYEQKGEYGEALVYIRQLLALEPWQEEAHQHLMRLLAWNGQRSAALAQYEKCRQQLAIELQVEPGKETLALYESIRAGTLAPPTTVPFSPLVEEPEKPVELSLQAAPSTPRHNLPRQLSHFIGREKEIAQVKGLVAEYPLVTLTGPGGVGKTRLALAVAETLLEDYPHGVWFVNLASLSDPDQVISTTGRVVGMHIDTGPHAQETLLDYCRNRQLLLVLDNCEHLIEACARLAEVILTACPKVKILATSREMLSVPGESIYPLLPFPSPSIENLPELERLLQFEAVRLFIDRAAKIQQEFALTPHNAPAVGRICAQLDGIPLALELAAARVRMLQVEEIAQRLDDRFRLLTGGSRAALPRYQTLRASIDWSYELLSPAERMLLQRLSVFAGSWVMEAAEYVGCGEGIESCDVLNLLGGLVNKSMVSVEAGTSSETRYRMLETIRQYTHEKLAEAGQAETTRNRHLLYYVELAEKVEWKIRGPDQALILGQLEAELYNLRLAFEWCTTQSGTLRDNQRASWLTEQGLRLGAALLWFWHIHGRTEEGLKLLRRLLVNEVEIRGMPGQLEEALEPGKMMARAKALIVASWFLILQYEYNQARELLLESQELYVKLGEQGNLGYALALILLSIVVSFHGDYLQQEKYLKESLAIAGEKGDKFLLSEAIMCLGENALKQHAYDRASMYFEESLTLYREIGDLEGVAHALSTLGNMVSSYYPACDPILDEQARALLEESKEIYRSVNSVAMSETDEALGSLYWKQGNYVAAVKCFNEILSAGRINGDLRSYADGLSFLGGLALSQGELREAAELFGEALTLGQKRGQKRVITKTKINLGALAWEIGDFEQAARNYADALKLIHGEKVSYEAEILIGHGRVCLAQGEYVEAWTYLQEALGKSRSISPQWALKLMEAISILVVRKQVKTSISESERAARLLGASQSLHTKWVLTRSPRERQERENAIASVQQALGEKVFLTAWEEGRAMTLEQAMEFALEENE